MPTPRQVYVAVIGMQMLPLPLHHPAYNSES
jgi:hypothetical protein